MTGDEATLAMIDTLESLGIPYMVVGSFSSNVYGIPRSTLDADFVIQLGPKTIDQISTRLGPDFVVDRQMSFETATGTSRHVIDVLGTAFKIELFHLGDDPHEQERFSRRRRDMVQGRTTWVPSAEDVLITKLRWSHRLGRHKDEDDARNLLGVQGDALDWDYIHSWADRHGTRELLDEIRKSIPPI
jgi:hypothetical protein